MNRIVNCWEFGRIFTCSADKKAGRTVFPTVRPAKSCRILSFFVQILMWNAQPSVRLYFCLGRPTLP